MRKRARILTVASISVLLLTALSLHFMGLIEIKVAYASPYTDVDVDTAYDMITNGSFPDLVVLDVRTQGEYDSGHIYGAVWIPVAELESRISELAGHENHEMIVYCKAGSRSATASGILDSYGFTKVYNMLGGFDAWKVAGYPQWIATVHNLNTTFNYDTIQAAIDVPQTLGGHVILADAGTYYENIVLHKSLSLVGENVSTTIIDGSSIGSVINVTAGNAAVSFFTIRHSGAGVYDSGIYANSSTDHNINNNIIANNSCGIYLELSSNNTIFHNNFINNTYHAQVDSVLDSTWDDGYPSGGNYWDDYAGQDLYRGPYQDVLGSDGIGDTPYVMDVNNTDQYPLMTPYDIGIAKVSVFPTQIVGPPPGVNEYFTVNITIADVSDLYVWQAGLTFDPTLLECTSIAEGEFLKRAGVTTLWTPGTINNTTGEIGYSSCSLTGATPGVSGTGQLMNITFRVTTGGNSSLNLTDVILLDSNLVAIAPLTTTDGYVEIHGQDIAILDITTSATEAYPTWIEPLNITVVVENQGTKTETFNVTVFANITEIDTQEVTLASGANTTLVFIWNVTGMAEGIYTIQAEADVLYGETDTADNTLIFGTVKLKHPGDANDDDLLNAYDLGILGKAWGTSVGDELFDPRADFNGDGTIDEADHEILKAHWP